MSEPGLELHEWETRWQELESQLEEDPAGALPDATDLLERILAEAHVEPAAREAGSELHTSVRAAREVADRVERGEDVDPGDVGQAINDLRAVYETVSAARPR